MTLHQSRTFSISINRPAPDVYAFVRDPHNLPRWATAFCKSVRQSGGEWIVETLQGPVKFRFGDENAFGVADHYATVAPGIEVYVPMRVVANGSGSELLFTLFRLPEMSDQQYTDDAAMVQQDLATLKRLLE